MPTMDIFQALADPNRRHIMGQLQHSRELSITDLCQDHQMSRQALTKHLNKLVQAGLITKRQAGKQRLHRLNPMPLKEVADWLQPYAALWDQRLDQLKQFVEDQHD